MAKVVKFQDPGEGIHDAEVVDVFVSVGDEIKEGQVALVVETDKANFEIESPHSGVIGEVHVGAGDLITVGTTLLTLEAESGSEDVVDSDEPSQETDSEHDEKRRTSPERRESTMAERDDVPADDGSDQEEEESASDATPSRESSDAGGDGNGRRPIPASPATRRLARSMGVDLGEVTPSGEDGRVLAQDVRSHLTSGPRQSQDRGALPIGEEMPDFSRWGAIERVPLRSVRRTIARRMARAWTSIPHVTHTEIADITDLEALRRRQAARLEADGDRLTLTAFLMKATAAVLREFPRFNASLDAEHEEIIHKQYYHLGVAVDTDRGLFVPSVRDVDRKSVLELCRELVEVSERARNGGLERDEMMRATFTITNVGAIGGVYSSPIINSPQVAILGLGRARLEPRVRDVDGDLQIVPRRVLPLSLAFDHRINDGADAARFTNRLVEILGDPEWFALSI